MPALPFSTKTGTSPQNDITHLQSISPQGGVWTQIDQDNTFTITLTGVAGADPTGIARWWRNGDQITLLVPNLSGTSDATTASLTGLPGDIQASRIQHVPVLVTDNGANAIGIARINSGSGTIDLYPGAALGTWTASGTKAIEAVVIN